MVLTFARDIPLARVHVISIIYIPEKYKKMESAGTAKIRPIIRVFQFDL